MKSTTRLYNGNTFHSLKTNGFVYLAKDDMGNIKVGSSSSYESRIKQLRTKCKSIKLVATIKANRFTYLEKLLHDRLRRGKHEFNTRN